MSVLPAGGAQRRMIGLTRVGPDIVNNIEAVDGTVDAVKNISTARSHADTIIVHILIAAGVDVGALTGRAVGIDEVVGNKPVRSGEACSAGTTLEVNPVTGS